MNDDVRDFGICDHCKPVLYQGMGHYAYGCEVHCACPKCEQTRKDWKAYERGLELEKRGAHYA